MHAIQLRGGRGRYSAGGTGSFSHSDRRKLSRRHSHFGRSTRAPRFSKFFVYSYKYRKLAGGAKNPFKISGSFGLKPGRFIRSTASEKTFSRIHRTDDGLACQKSHSIIAIGSSKPSWTATAQSQSLMQPVKLGSGCVIDCRLNVSSRPFEMQWRN